MSDDPKDPQDQSESAMVEATAKKLGEHFESVLILCSRSDGKQGTRVVAKQCGNWHAQIGMAREWMLFREEYIKESAREQMREPENPT